MSENSGRVSPANIGRSRTWATVIADGRVEESVHPATILANDSRVFVPMACPASALELGRTIHRFVTWQKGSEQMSDAYTAFAEANL